MIIVSASVFGYYLNWEQIPQSITAQLLELTTNKYAMLAILNILMLVLGMFLEGGACTYYRSSSIGSGGDSIGSRSNPLWCGDDRQHHAGRSDSSFRIDDVHDLQCDKGSD